MKKQVTLYADKGMVITDGEFYGTTISVAVGGDIDKYYEITQEEYEKRQELLIPNIEELEIIDESDSEEM